MVARRDTAQAEMTTGDARRRILDAARRAFATAGFEGASTRAIALEASVAQSLLLYHFKSKEALWRAVMDDVFAGLNDWIIHHQPDLRDAGPAKRLMVLVRGFIDFCASDADIHRIITVEGRAATDRLKWLVDTHLRANHARVCALIRRGQEAGEVRPGDPTLLYYSFIAIAGTAFSLAPEIALVSGDDRLVEAQAIEDLIRALLLTDFATG